MFSELRDKIQKRFEQLSNQGSLFYKEVDRDAIWEAYLSGFEDPAVRQGNNCNCCKSFIRQFGGLVAITNVNEVSSIWEIENAPKEYAQAVKNLADYVKNLPITDKFLTEQRKCGTNKTPDPKNSVTWYHFYLEVPQQYVRRDIPSTLGLIRDSKTSLVRALNEIDSTNVEEILDIIKSGALYRGEEHKNILEQFLKLKSEYSEVKGDKDAWAWTKSIELPHVSRIRSSVIGSLLLDLQKGDALETAVTKFEARVAPHNYKRPKALITPKMIEAAQNRIKELGYENSLERRLANERDLNVEDIIYVDKASVISDVFGDMKKDIPVHTDQLKGSIEISIEEFIKTVVPGAKEMHVFLANEHQNNMVSLVTADNIDAKPMFQWSNPFSWSYTGGITDSIKERVKAAGGKIDAVLRVSLSWSNFDDLDIHVIQPKGRKIYYSASRDYGTSGFLDVDMNAGSHRDPNPVENITWSDRSKMENGEYTVLVNNFSRRESKNDGYTVQIEYMGRTYEFSNPKNPGTGGTHTIVKFKFDKKKDALEISGGKTSVLVKEKWGLKTQHFHKVKQFMLSPNFWGQESGNKHYMFFLENCISDEDARPFFNEFLKADLAQDRKVLEVLGSKLQVPRTNNQLSGIGFSSTKRDELVVRVKTNKVLTYKVKF